MIHAMNQGAEQFGVTHAWAFAALSIQTYILETGRLADAVGASLLVDQLTGDLTDGDDDNSLLALVMSASKVTLGTDLRFARRGGGAFIAVFDDREALCRTRLLWQAALHQNAPGLRWADGLGSGTHSGAAVEAARMACEDNGRVDLARLPEAGPLALRVARTGQPASVRRSLGEKRTEALDAATEARRRHGATRAGQGRLTDRFSTEPGLAWPGPAIWNLPTNKRVAQVTGTQSKTWRSTHNASRSCQTITRWPSCTPMAMAWARCWPEFATKRRQPTI